MLDYYNYEYEFQASELVMLTARISAILVVKKMRKATRFNPTILWTPVANLVVSKVVLVFSANTSILDNFVRVYFSIYSFDQSTLNTTERNQF